MITLVVYQKDTVRELCESKVTSTSDYAWLAEMRFYFDSNVDLMDCVSVQVGDTAFKYGFEYHGIQDKLAQTPLTRRCYISMAQALSRRLGGSPFGPAGTGKTETVKSMAQQLGRMCLVFCCDENFDFQAMGRIFLGLSHVGAWGCFDEFNRLEESILSAVSQQVQAIQAGLKLGSNVELLGNTVAVHPDTGTSTK
jgi:dynein heavy chain 1